jgi:hypothetical protein
MPWLGAAQLRSHCGRWQRILRGELLKVLVQLLLQEDAAANEQ